MFWPIRPRVTGRHSRRRSRREGGVTTLSMTEAIHPSAVIGPDVDLADDVQVGPFSILEGHVRVGPGCVIEGHACLSGPLTLGRNNFVGHGAVLGKAPQ